MPANTLLGRRVNALAGTLPVFHPHSASGRGLSSALRPWSRPERGLLPGDHAAPLHQLDVVVAERVPQPSGFPAFRTGGPQRPPVRYPVQTPLFGLLDDRGGTVPAGRTQRANVGAGRAILVLGLAMANGRRPPALQCGTKV